MKSVHWTSTVRQGVSHQRSHHHCELTSCHTRELQPRSLPAASSSCHISCQPRPQKSAQRRNLHSLFNILLGPGKRRRGSGDSSAQPLWHTSGLQLKQPRSSSHTRSYVGRRRRRDCVEESDRQRKATGGDWCAPSCIFLPALSTVGAAVHFLAGPMSDVRLSAELLLSVCLVLCREFSQMQC